MEDTKTPKKPKTVEATVVTPTVKQTVPTVADLKRRRLLMGRRYAGVN